MANQKTAKKTIKKSAEKISGKSIIDKKFTSKKPIEDEKKVKIKHKKQVIKEVQKQEQKKPEKKNAPESSLKKRGRPKGSKNKVKIEVNDTTADDKKIEAKAPEENSVVNEPPVKTEPKKEIPTTEVEEVKPSNKDSKAPDANKQKQGLRFSELLGELGKEPPASDEKSDDDIEEIDTEDVNDGDDGGDNSGKESSSSSGSGSGSGDDNILDGEDDLFDDHKLLAELGIECIDALISFPLMLIAKSDDEDKYSLTDKRKKKIQKPLELILRKRDFKISPEFVFVIFLLIAYTPMVRMAVKERKAKNIDKKTKDVEHEDQTGKEKEKSKTDNKQETSQKEA